MPLYPGFYPGQYVYPGANYMWLDAATVGNLHPPRSSKGPQAQFNHYSSDVAGQLLLPSLDVAIDFLLNDPNVAMLQYV